MHLLLIEDDAETAGFVVRALREAGHVVEHTDNGRDGLFLASATPYDALIIDRLLPQMDGLRVVTALRASGVHTPALFLSALSATDERVRGLRAGADDYLAKPFSLDELLARIEAITRRGRSEAEPAVLRVADLELDRVRHELRRAGERIELQPQHYRVLDYLMRHAGQLVTRSMLLEQAWGYRFDPNTNIVDVNISQLRQRIDRPGRPALIHTVRGAGYLLRAPD